jgi:hypothetical protein
MGNPKEGATPCLGNLERLHGGGGIGDSSERWNGLDVLRWKCREQQPRLGEGKGWHEESRSGNDL